MFNEIARGVDAKRKKNCLYDACPLWRAKKNKYIIYSGKRKTSEFCRFYIVILYVYIALGFERAARDSCEQKYAKVQLCAI